MKNDMIRFVSRLALMMLVLGTAQAAAENHHISQKNRTFAPKELNVTAGDTIEFANDDDFIHQVHVDDKKFNFDSAESPPGNSVDIKFTTPGTYEVRCHIHPKMALKVTVH